MAFLGQQQELREFQNRFRYLYAVMSIALAIIVLRLVYLQIFSGQRMRQTAEENRIKRVNIAAPRGMIFDRNGTLLVDNRPAFDLEITPQYLASAPKEEIPKILAKVGKLVGMSVEEIQSQLNKSRNQPRFMPVKVKTNLSRDEMAMVKTWQINLPGVSVEMEIQRTNVYREVASHLLGYIGEVNASELPQISKKNLGYKLGDRIGKFGLEQQMEEMLRGSDGERLVEVDASGRVRLEKSRGRVLDNFSVRPEVPGKNLILTIDQDLQLEAVKALGARSGAVVAIDPMSGEILAMVSQPSFDPTEFSRGVSSATWNRLMSDPNKPMMDKTIQGYYMPGSVFKAVTAITGLEEGAVDENDHFRCTGQIKVGNRVVHCHKKEGHGEVNIVSAISQSCDIYFYRLAQKLRSVDQIATWSKHMGLGSKTGVPLAGEVSGLVPTEEWKRKRYGEAWNVGETLSVAIGQGFNLTSIIQLANLYATIANGGKLFKPFIVKKVQSFEGQVLQEFEPKVIDQTGLKAKTYQLIKQGLWGVINSPIGTAYRQRLPGMDFVGKTGTAQLFRIAAEKIYQRCENMKLQDRHHALFAGFAPAGDPKIAVAVIVEHGCAGSAAAAPVARAVVKTYLEKHFPERFGKAVLGEKMKEADSQSKAAVSVPEEEVFIDDGRVQ